MRFSGTLSSVVLCATLAACAPRGDVKGKATLYDRLGGKNAIEAVVVEMLNNVKEDSRINGKFAQTNLEDLRGKLVDQICQGAGGPCQYQGKDMKAAHLGMGLTGGDFNALVEDLSKALDKLGVGAAEKKDVLGMLAPMSKDIVEN